MFTLNYFMFALNNDHTELCSHWTMFTLNHVHTELCSHWTTYVHTELCSHRTMFTLNYVHTELCSHWTMFTLNYLCSHWTMFTQNYVHTEQRTYYIESSSYWMLSEPTDSELGVRQIVKVATMRQRDNVWGLLNHAKICKMSRVPSSAANLLTARPSS